MPVIDLQASLDPTSELWLGIDFTADQDADLGLHSLVTLGIGLIATLDLGGFSASTTFGVDIDSASILRVDPAEINIQMSAVATLGINISPILLPNDLDFLAVFEIGIDQPTTSSVWGDPEKSELILTLNITESVVFPANYQQYTARFKVGSSELKIKRAFVSAPRNRIGVDFTVTLSNPEDRSSLSNGATYTLEIGFVVSGVTNWVKVASGKITTHDYSIGYAENSPTDEVSLSTSADMSYLLNSSPYYPVVFYDPSYIKITEEDLQPIYDASGNLYPHTILAVNGLSLYYIVGYAFAQIGLNWSINIPDFKIKRLDIDVGQPFFQAIGGLFGVFEPLFLEKNGLVNILDSTLLQPVGWSTNKEITPSKYKTLKINKTYPDINGYIVQYVESHDAWDRFTDDVNTSINEILDEDENRLTRLIVKTTQRRYYRNSLPAVTVREETIKVVTETWVNDPVIYGDVARKINSSTEVFVYDHVGKILRHKKVEFQQVPIWISSGGSNGHWEYSFEEVKYEQEDYVYKESPYKKGTEYREHLYQFTRALVFTDPDLLYETKEIDDTFEIDPEKEVPVKYKQLYVDAYRGGNLNEDGEVSFEPVKARHEFVVPVSKDTARVEVKDVDHLTKQVILNVTDEQIGEFATSSQVAQTRRTMVFGGDQTRNTRRMDTLNIGEIPLDFGIPLAIRKLNRALSSAEMQLENIGADLTIDRGTLLDVIGRDSVNLGQALVEGWSILLDRLGTPEQIVMSTYDVTKINDSNIYF